MLIVASQDVRLNFFPYWSILIAQAPLGPSPLYSVGCQLISRNRKKGKFPISVKIEEFLAVALNKQ